ncbi:helix-turn-helix domain-containing protein [Dyadobacter sp. CY312]|uniref:winged helix-turn-helix transcriptional regulator n=1 Tax=Dyadobacter sp. CY312 TaxID=2907303 RepID=UPI001F1B3113|nr:helix-turn-helix domain-containing protein [Dyadobacter sp. CY312]MCE7038833.1 helix-turn-helix transcriptional regulator [Dyadobacter sp. CY312]
MKAGKETLNRSDCPISYALDLVGDKWTLLILRDMIFAGKSSYGEFLQSDEKIATNILADRLNALTDNGFVIKSVSPENKSKFIYTLTDKAISLLPVIIELSIWGSKNSTAELNSTLPDVFKKDKVKTIKEFTKVLKKRLSNVSDTE